MIDGIESVKDGALDTVAEQVGCCRGAFEFALNAGLMSLGIPPDLPDFEQLQEMGEGYLASTLAKAAGVEDIPFAEDAIKAGIEEFIDEGLKTSGGENPTLGWIPDPAQLYQALTLTYDVRNETGDVTPPWSLVFLDEGSGQPSGKRYQTRKMEIPPMQPGEEFRISVALDPVVDPASFKQVRCDLGAVVADPAFSACEQAYDAAMLNSCAQLVRKGPKNMSPSDLGKALQCWFAPLFPGSFQSLACKELFQAQVAACNQKNANSCTARDNWKSWYTSGSVTFRAEWARFGIEKPVVGERVICAADGKSPCVSMY